MPWLVPRDIPTIRVESIVAVFGGLLFPAGARDFAAAGFPLHVACHPAIFTAKPLIGRYLRLSCMRTGTGSIFRPNDYSNRGATRFRSLPFGNHRPVVGTARTRPCSAHALMAPPARPTMHKSARLSATRGYHRYWLAEHHNIPDIASAATAVAIGHVAVGTSHIRVISGFVRYVGR